MWGVCGPAQHCFQAGSLAMPRKQPEESPCRRNFLPTTQRTGLIQHERIWGFLSWISGFVVWISGFVVWIRGFVVVIMSVTHPKQDISGISGSLQLMTETVQYNTFQLYLEFQSWPCYRRRGLQTLELILQVPQPREIDIIQKNGITPMQPACALKLIQNLNLPSKRQTHSIKGANILFYFFGTVQ